MNKWILALAMLAVVASGCSKKDDTSTVSPSPSVTVQPSAGASATPSGTSAGGAVGGTVTATPTPKGTTGGGAAETPSTLTKEQVEKITLTSTYDDLVKQTGSKGKLVKEENGKRTYEFAISNQAGYYAEIVYFNDGKISEKRVFQR
jgi:PBP1b-binding outer membrane lipoprotein LpoB